MLAKASNRGLVKGLLEDFRPGGIISLQYADDTILFSKADAPVLRNLKCVLMSYEQISGMRINFNKSELVPLNLDIEETHSFSPHFLLSCRCFS